MYFPLATTDLFSLSMRIFLFCYASSFLFWSSTYKWNHMISVFVWFISISIIHCRSTPVVANGKISFFSGSDGQESACNAGDLGLFPGLERIPWRREWQPTPVFLPGKSQGQRSLVGYCPWGPKEWDTTEWLTLWSPGDLKQVPSYWPVEGGGGPRSGAHQLVGG